MKLLGWMHRKLWHNSSDPLKDFSGQTSLDDQIYYQKRNSGTKHFKTAQRDTLFRKSFAGLEAARIEEQQQQEFYEEDSVTAASEEIFHGFLAIGTLGSDPVIGDPATPTFAYSVENITEKDTEITENELKLINEELEKVLGSEAREDWCTDSSGRNSHVSTGRSSHGSTITLSGKSIEGQEVVCPLKGYLLNSAIELPEATTVAKKEHRTSLGELFQKTKMTEEDYGKYGKEERRSEKEQDKSAMHLLKKKLMKKVLHASSKGSTTASGGTLEPNSAETRIHKILHMLHKKVHPENSAATKDPNKQQKNDINKKTSNRSCNNGNHLFSDEDIMIFPHRNIAKEKFRSLKGQPNPTQFTFAGNESNGNRECWIKTDADYLVLEL